MGRFSSEKGFFQFTYVDLVLTSLAQVFSEFEGENNHPDLTNIKS